MLISKVSVGLQKLPLRAMAGAGDTMPSGGCEYRFTDDLMPLKGLRQRMKEVLASASRRAVSIAPIASPPRSSRLVRGHPHTFRQGTFHC
jgi:hypothetical protein